MRALIVGCGYVGFALGSELVRQGHEVFGMRRSPDAQERMRAAGIQPITADVTHKEQWSTIPGPFDWVVMLVSSSKGGIAEYQQAYLQGMRHLIEWLTPTPPRKLVYTSSTSVYGQSDGSSVKETAPTTPTADTARVLVETEQVLLANAKALSAVILRVAGIYGPDRTYFLRQFVENQVRIEGRGERHMNMIHLADLVGIIIAALKYGRPSEVYNAVDDEPVMQVHFYRWLSETLGKWMPPFAAAEEAQHKRAATNKKVLNRKLKMELGYTFKYPTFRQGYTAEIQRLEAAGLLDIEPDPR